VPDAAERLINLAMFLASARGFVTAEQVRSEVDGYAADQDESAFIRMFERDKDELRAAGLEIVSDAEGRYRLDAEGTFAASIRLSAAENASLRVVAAAFASDPAFPFAEDLRLALAKLATDADSSEPGAVVRLAEEGGQGQGERVTELDTAVSACKRVQFDYVNALGDHKHHVVDPYGQFVRDGTWYLVARDTELDEPRVYTVGRISGLTVNSVRPKSADFSLPAGFDVAQFIGLPFQYGGDDAVAVVRFDASCAWKAPAFASVSGSLSSKANGTALWTVRVRDLRALRSWVIENGPGIRILEPRTTAGTLEQELREVAGAHGR